MARCGCGTVCSCYFITENGLAISGTGDRFTPATLSLVLAPVVDNILQLRNDGLYAAATTAAGGLTGTTEDTGETYKVILFSDGRTKSVPVSATAPAAPTGLSRTVRVNSVRLSWIAVTGAASYIIYRDGVQVGTTTQTAYRDKNVTLSATYTYGVRAANQYEQRSPISTTVSAFIDPALNVTPTIEVRSWPTTVATNGRAIIRVNAKDLDTQTLALALNVDVGTLISTADPSVWILVP